MSVTVLCLLAAPVVIALVAVGRYVSPKARAEREARAREAKEKAEAFISAQYAYFETRGVRTVRAKMSPRQADIGTLLIEHHEASHWQSDDDGSWHSTPIVCKHGCGAKMIFLEEVAPGDGREGQGSAWRHIGRYCADCGAWSGASAQRSGPLTRLTQGITNIFDALGDRDAGSPDGEWRRLGDEEHELEARLNVVRTRRLALAEKLGKPIGSPFRPQVMAGGKES